MAASGYIQSAPYTAVQNGQPFPIKRLPQGVREMVFVYVLYLQHDHSAPSVLVTLASDADMETTLYNRAREIYFRINAISPPKMKKPFISQN
jgi:hypothetical protein